MKKYPNLTLAAIMCFAILVGSIQGQRLDRLFEVEAFLQWMAAAAANERLDFDESTEHEDSALYSEVVAATQDQVAAEVTGELEEGHNALSEALEDSKYDAFLYKMAKSDELKPLRDEFLESLRSGKLRYTQNVTYAAVVSGMEGQGSVSIFNLFFGFRKVAANFVWLQVDRYWHAGLLHRMIPLMKTCVLLDPGFVDAYLLGSWHLGYNVTASMDFTPYPLRTWSDKYQDCIGDQQNYYYIAVDFLKDGIRNNPRNYKLYFDLGFSMYREKLNDTENAVKYLTRAARLPHERWVPRMLYKCLEENGDYEKALEGWKINLERFPGHEVTLRSIERIHGLIAERNAQQARMKAKGTTDPVERENLMSEYRAHVAEARAIWEKMNEPFSVGRLLRLDAIDRADKGLYLEAVSLLDKGRYETGSLFDEFSNLIIEFKHAGGLPLSLSEQKQMIREEESTSCIGMPESVRQERLIAYQESQQPTI
tara:strand:- start:420 stop:1862 length:1443 start_codon:yes stop_codon:yes gene_type:complete